MKMIYNGLVSKMEAEKNDPVPKKRTPMTKPSFLSTGSSITPPNPSDVAITTGLSMEIELRARR